tara:strand:- start:167 stop:295 length:129 start_codon:yes stop_codon:yes gene_type:complete
MNKREKFNKEVDKIREEKYKNSDIWKSYQKDINNFQKELLNS